jgi:hypothetical protein
MATNDTRCTRDINSRVSMETGVFNKKNVFTTILDVSLRKNLVFCFIWRIHVDLYSAET